MNMAQRTMENLKQLDGLVIGVESGLVTDEQLVEFLTNCSEEDFAVMQAELTQDVVKDLGEKTGAGDLSALLGAVVKSAYEAMKARLVTPGALKLAAVQGLTAESRRVLATAMLKAKAVREAKKNGKMPPWLKKGGKDGKEKDKK